MSNLLRCTTKKKGGEENQKLLGAYYTPRKVCQMLTDWAIVTKSDKVLEPSFGGCCFLEAAMSRLAELGASDPSRNLFGCDIDPRAFLHLQDTIGGIASKDKFIQSDFLNLDSSSFAYEKFDSIIGNPPYVSHHNLSLNQKRTASKAMLQGGFQVARLSSLWGYFVLHSLKFLEDGARIAWILPSSFLHAEYSKPIRNELLCKFNKVHAIVLQKRLFLSEGTKESTVVLLGDGYNRAPDQNDIELMAATTLEDLSKTVSSIKNKTHKPKLLKGTAALSLLDSDTQYCYSQILALEESKKFAEIADIKIGTVTGANHFFVISRDISEKNNLVCHTKPILAKFDSVPGLSYTKQDHVAAEAQNKRCYILNAQNSMEKGSAIRNYLATFPRGARRINATFKKRGLWFQADDEQIPDGFFTYMHHAGPRLVLNAFNVNCTNTIHRVYFKQKITPVQKKLLAISLLSTFSQFSAEVEGRCYGSGVLKLEPSEVKRLSILLPDIGQNDTERGYRSIDQLLRAGRVDDARDAADSLIIGKISSRIALDALHKLSSALTRMRDNRTYNSALN